MLDEVDESHLMRFLFPQEVKYYLNAADFQLMKICPFMGIEREISEKDWTVAVVAMRR